MNRMKKAGLVLLVIAMMFTSMPFGSFAGTKVSAAAAEVGVFYNGDIELGTASTITGWSNPGGSFSVSMTENHSPSGTRSIRIDPTGSLWGYVRFNNVDNSLGIPIVQNVTYRVSFWHKGGANGQLQCGDFGIPNANMAVNNDADWTLYTRDYVVYTRPALTPFDLKNNNSSSGAASYFDDFSLTMITTPAPTVANPTPSPTPSLMMTTAGKTGNMKIGSNFWFLSSWTGEEPFKTGINWATAYANGDNIWSATFLSEISTYVDLRFMDWGNTNNSSIVSWDQRRLPNDPGTEHLTGLANNPGLAYEWMIELCNRTNKDLWVCVPHQVNDAYVTNMALLIKEKLNPNLKCYIEYSNEVWNGGFQQYNYAETQGGLLGFTTNKNAQFYVTRSFQVFELFKNVFQGEMSTRVIKVCCFSGNFSVFDLAYDAITKSATYNPHGQAANLLAVAPYVGSGIDGYDPNAVTKFHQAIDKTFYTYVLSAVAIAKKYGVPLATYESGQHLLLGANALSSNQSLYNEYLYMLNKFAPYFVLFNHYAHCGTWSSGESWGALDHTGQSILDAPKYRALVDWHAASSNPTPAPAPIPNGQLQNASFQDGLTGWELFLSLIHISEPTRPY